MTLLKKICPYIYFNIFIILFFCLYSLIQLNSIIVNSDVLKIYVVYF